LKTPGELGQLRVTVERGTASTNVIDVLDRVLDKGIVIDAWLRVSVIGIDLVTVEARVVVASLETYLRYADWTRRPASELTVKQLARNLQLQLEFGAPSAPPTDLSEWRKRSPPKSRGRSRRDGG
jgi:Gas vesicle protein